MSDTITLNAGSGGSSIAADDLGAAGFAQRIKLIHGTDGVSAGDVAITNPLPVGLPFATRQDTYAANGNGTTVDVSARPCKYFGIQVKKTGSVTSWSVELQVSLDGTNWQTLMTHTDSGDGDGTIVWIPQPTVALYFRSKCTMTLGAGTNVVATILGTN